MPADPNQLASIRAAFPKEGDGREIKTAEELVKRALKKMASGEVTACGGNA
jgi:hypothetical protein